MNASYSQTTSTILMVRPHRFGFNEQTMASNAFQRQDQGEGQDPATAAQAEFDQLVALLRQNEVEVIVKQDTPEPLKPDAVFPNNWVIFHHNGDVSLFPMEAANRRFERRQDILDDLRESFDIKRIHDFSDPEKNGRYLEGTGSLILDHSHRIAYACLSSRTDAGLLRNFCVEMGYEEQSFKAFDQQGKPVYHTNVIMCVGRSLAVLCTEAIQDRSECRRVVSRLRETGHELLEISQAQVLEFAGNMLQLSNKEGEALLLMSSRAYQALKNEQRQLIESHCRIIHSPLTTIENLGGGSARCMVAEIFLPRRN